MTTLRIIILAATALILTACSFDARFPPPISTQEQPSIEILRPLNVLKVDYSF